MGQKLKISTIMTSMILLSGILGFGLSADAQQVPPDIPDEAAAGQAQGCAESGERSSERASAAARNPHCEEEEPEPSPCDTVPEGGDGIITEAELLAVPGATQDDVDNALLVADTDDSGSIDTDDELALLKTFPTFSGC